MEECVKDISSLQFIMQVLGGKWKLFILTTLYFGTKRFKELEREISGISPKMLIKELKDLEQAGIVKRETFNTVPITVKYSITEEGLTLEPIITQMKNWAEDFKKNQAEKIKLQDVKV
ncbi:MAG: helix-turn-helix domain-containing protein [Flavobacterium sp.]